MLRGNWKNYWKFKVLVGLVSSYWFGSLISFYSVTAILHYSFWFSAALFMVISLTHLTFVVLTQKVSFFQASFGTWKWDAVLERVASSMPHVTGSTTLSSMTIGQVDQFFDLIDADGSGKIDAGELKLALEKIGDKMTMANVLAMMTVADENGDGAVDREEFHNLICTAAVRSIKKSERRIRRSSLALSITKTGKGLLEYPSTLSGVTFGTDADTQPSRSECAFEKKLDHSVRHGLPSTYQEVLPPGKGDTRAIIVTEAKYPHVVLGVNEAREDRCGYKSSEALQKNMANLMQGPETNREGLKHSMDQLVNGAEHVECNIVNYRKDETTFNNSVAIGPIYDEGSDADEEEGLRKASYYVGILKQTESTENLEI